MDLIFQSGEFYSQESTLGSTLKFLLPLLGAVISGGIAIWIFNRGIRKRREEEEEKEQKRLDELREYVLTIIKLLIQPIDQQIASYHTLIATLKSPNGAISLSPVYESGLDNARNFSDVPHKDLYKIFVTNEKGDTSDKAELLQKVNVHIYYLKKRARHSFINLFEYFEEKRKNKVLLSKTITTVLRQLAGIEII